MPTLKAEIAPALRQAEDEHQLALVPATPAQITRILMEMRLSTQPRRESPNEAEASFKVLVRELADVPLDIIREACRLYIRAERFFPRSPAELLVHSNPLLAQRRRRARNLARMAQEAERLAREKTALKHDPMATIDDLRELARNPSVGRSVFAMYVAKGWASQADVDRVLKEIVEPVTDLLEQHS